MSFNRETGGRFFSPDNQAGRALELPASTQFDWARTIIESKHALLDAAHMQTAIGIQQEVAELLPPFQKRDDVPQTIYVTSFNKNIRGTNEENRRDETLDIIELDTVSGKLYQAKRGFTNFDIAQSPGIRTVAATKTETYSREELGTTGWLEFGGKAVDALQRVAKRIEIGKPYENPRHRVYKKLKLVPDDPNPEPIKEELILSPREIAVLLEDMDNVPQRPLT